MLQTEDYAMIEPKTQEFNQAQGRLASDIKTVIADGENVFKAVANVSGTGLAAAREKLDNTLSHAGKAIADASRPAIDQAKRSAAVADDYVRDNPWQLIGVAAVAGALIGYLAARR
jgi:ElaB/YqjD/DUF883 family membrane-anchored ribosome-binding protein